MKMNPFTCTVTSVIEEYKCLCDSTFSPLCMAVIHCCDSKVDLERCCIVIQVSNVEKSIKSPVYVITIDVANEYKFRSWILSVIKECLRNYIAVQLLALI